ncbi:MAG TPA: mechanosensitive ion channel [Proteobacteria bacterium]|nr:mechanosensitive ion channel [Pseudomonadota bacterium]
MERYLEKALDLAMLYGMKVVAALVIVVLGRWAAQMVCGLMEKVLKKQKIDQTIISFVGNLAYFSILTFVVIAALSKLGLQTTSFIAVLGAAGLAVGLALQGSLANFAAGVLMIVFRPFKGGDYIDGGGVSGLVDEINVFTTILKTPDNKKVIVPNATMMGGNIVNYSAFPTRRVDLTIGVSYGDNLKKVKKVLAELAAADRRVLPQPLPFVAVAALADSSVDLVMRLWTRTEDYWNLYFDMLEAIKLKFDEEGISIPFPQQDVHLFNPQPEEKS